MHMQIQPKTQLEHRTMKIFLLSLLLHVAEAIVCGSTNGGNTYDVGAGLTYSTIGSVPLNTLQPGDHVCIYPGVYREKFVINRSGTSAAPVVFQGVPDGAGNLPVIDGDGASTPTGQDYWNEARNLIKVGGASSPTPDGGGIVSHVRIEGLKLRNARQQSGLTFTGDNGVSGQSYAKNAACVMIEQGYNIDIVSNEITNCGNGIFISPNQSGDIMVERNYIYGNGADDSYFEHNVSSLDQLPVVF